MATEYRLGLDEIDAAYVSEILNQVYKALEEKGYSPRDQIIGYLMSGDPTFITDYNDARRIIQKVEIDEILSFLLGFYADEEML